MKPKLRNLFMKWLTRDRVVPIIFRESFLTDLCRHWFRPTFLAKVGHQ